MVHANLTAPSFIEPELWAIELLAYIAGMAIFFLFCSCDLDLDPMTFMYETDPYSVEIYIGCVNINFLRQGFRNALHSRSENPGYTYGVT